MPEKPDSACVSRAEFYRAIGVVIGIFVMLLLLLQVEISSVQAQQKKYNTDKAEELKLLTQIQQTVGDLDLQIVTAKKQEKP